MTHRLEDLYKGVLWLGALATAALVLVVTMQPASYTDGLMLSLVLASAFFVVCSAVTWVGVAFRRRKLMQVGDTYVLQTSLRQGVIAGSTTVILLILQLLRVISSIDAFLLIGLAIVIELFLGSRKAAQ